jgi:UDP-glucose 4-epimerase
MLVADASAFRDEFGWSPSPSDLETVVATAWRWLQRWKALDSVV